jgi:hypothetical protein
MKLAAAGQSVQWANFQIDIPRQQRLIINCELPKRKDQQLGENSRKIKTSRTYHGAARLGRLLNSLMHWPHEWLRA